MILKMRQKIASFDLRRVKYIPACLISTSLVLVLSHLNKTFEFRIEICFRWVKYLISRLKAEGIDFRPLYEDIKHSWNAPAHGIRGQKRPQEMGSVPGWSQGGGTHA